MFEEKANPQAIDTLGDFLLGHRLSISIVIVPNY
jgi:hypothetical protein